MKVHLRCLLPGIFVAIAGSVGHTVRMQAQGVVISDVRNPDGTPNPQAQAFLQQAFSAMQAAYDSRVARITPALVTVDPQTHAATLTVMNPSNDTLAVTLVAGVTPPRSVGGRPSSTTQANGLVDDRSASSADTIEQAMSLAPWIQGLPSHLTLAPHAQMSVSVHLNVPPTAKNGTYAAWIVTTAIAANNSATQTASTPGQKISVGGGGFPDTEIGPDGKERPVERQSGTKLVYTITK